MWLEKMLAAGVKTDAFSYNSVINVWQPSNSTGIGRETDWTFDAMVDGGSDLELWLFACYQLIMGSQGATN